MPGEAGNQVGVPGALNDFLISSLLSRKHNDSGFGIGIGAGPKKPLLPKLVRVGVHMSDFVNGVNIYRSGTGVASAIWAKARNIEMKVP